MMVVLTWTRISAFLLCLPPLVAGKTFLDLDTCAVRQFHSSSSSSAQFSASLLVYVAVVTFFLPSRRARSKAYLHSRSVCAWVTIFRLSTTPGTLSCSSMA